MSEKIIVIGASGHGKVIADIIQRCGDTVYGFLDDDTSKQGVIGSIADCLCYPDMQFVIAIGNNQTRRMLAEKYALRYYTAIHPSAVIADSASVGEGSVVMANAVINADAVVGRHCIINTSSVVEHDNRILDYVHISPGAVLCGTVTIGESTHIGAATVVKNNITVGPDIVVGCGGCVIKDIMKPGVYAGVPIKKLHTTKMEGGTENDESFISDTAGL